LIETPGSEMGHKHIFLTGFMGVGKSTVGTILACELGLDFIDTDQLIMQRYGMSINSMFAHYGEAYFRDCETITLQEIGAASEAEFKVVSTGGGIVSRDNNLRLMREQGTIVYLHASWEMLKKRLCDVSNRPLARKGSNEKLHALWEQRLPLYHSADIKIDTSGLSPHQVVEQLLLRLKSSNLDG